MPPFRSMTGFGESEFQIPGFTGRIVCRSVNHKNLDTRVYLPREIGGFENAVIAIIKKYATRGRVEVRVELERESGGLSIDESQFKEIATQLKQLAKANGLAQPTVRDVVGSLTSSKVSLPDDVEELLLDAVDTCVRLWAKSREREGLALQPELEDLLADAKRHLTVIQERQASHPEETRNKVTARLEDTLTKLGAGELDETRFLQELILYTERGDISEEVQRAQTHLVELNRFVGEENEGPVGKKMDFYLQELFRECNTMGSKTSDVETTSRVIELKTIVEKLREQAANIE